MQGRSYSSEPYRFGYQGQFAEMDEETGWNAFELRMFEPVIGRWMATDPYGQFHSPYLGMGNNPINQVDPDGAWSKFGAWWRNGFKMNGVYQAGEGKRMWGFNRETGNVLWDAGLRQTADGYEEFTFSYAESEFYVGKKNYGEGIHRLMAYQPNFAGRIKGFIDSSSDPVSFLGGIGYRIADNAYISLFQVGGDRSNLEGFGVNRNEVTDAGVNTLMTLNPIGRTSSVLFKGINIASFNKYFKGSFIARLQPQLKGYILRGYNSMVHKGRIKTTISAVGAGAKATDAVLNDN